MFCKSAILFPKPKSLRDYDNFSLRLKVSSTSKNKDISLFDDNIDMVTEQSVSTSTMPNAKMIFTHPVAIKMEPSQSEPEHPIDINPMDFIDNDISTPDEEVFNLDTFDMLTDIPGLEDLNSDFVPGGGLSSSGSSTQSSSVSFKSFQSNNNNNNNNNQQSAMDYREGTANITDYSPDWSYIEVRIDKRIKNYLVLKLSKLLGWSKGFSNRTLVFVFISVYCNF